jgi:hypothetical protein
MPQLQRALAAGELGYEAARLVSRVATPETSDRWVARARERTLKHLREEVDAAEMLCRLGADAKMLPPDEETMAELFAIESRVISGAAFGSAERPEDFGRMSADLFRDFERARLTARARSLGQVTLRFQVSAGTARYYRWLERLFERHRPEAAAGRSFLHFLCSSLIDSWNHARASRHPYASVYARDRHRCTSPVCSRRDLTPHHLRFRSAGGNDSDENLASLCVWCHLEGIHGGRLRAAPPASGVEWKIGAVPHTVVRGRQREGVPSSPRFVPSTARAWTTEKC